MQSAHVVEPEFLNSQTIESRYGSYTVEMLASDGPTRQSALSSEDASGKICRTFAITRFTDAAESLDVDRQQQILNGASIGATLKEGGWSILKATIHVGSVEIDRIAHPVLALMQLDVPATLALHIYKLSIEKNGESLDYATISEMHHPDYLSEDDVRELFPVDSANTATPPEIDTFIASIREA
jgi:hypothetical protein